jgi:hypothetical protein
MTQANEFDKVAEAFEKAFIDAVKAKLEKLTAQLEREAGDQEPRGLGTLFAPPSKRPVTVPPMPKLRIPKDWAIQLDAENTRAELLREPPRLDAEEKHVHRARCYGVIGELLCDHPHDRERIERIIDGTEKPPPIDQESWRQLIARGVRKATQETGGRGAQRVPIRSILSYVGTAIFTEQARLESLEGEAKP